MKELPTRAYLVDFYFSQDFTVANPVSMYARSILFFGGPLEGYDNVDDRPDDQSAEIKDYVLEYLFEDMEVVADMNNSAQSNVFYFMGAH